MHYDIKYEGDNKEGKAIMDFIKFVGIKRFTLIRKEVKKGGQFEYIRMLCAFAGVQGFPVRALLKREHPRYIRRFRCSQK